jgi:hypothetical protein
LFYAKPQSAEAAGLAINVLISLQSLWVLVAAVSLQRRALLTRRSATHPVAEGVV